MTSCKWISGRWSLAVALGVLLAPCAAGAPTPSTRNGLPAASAEPEQQSLEGPLLEQVRRSREILHPGEPLHMVGVEIDGNSFRERTPALESHQKSGRQVDLTRLREARLNLFARNETRVAPAGALRASAGGDGRVLPAAGPPESGAATPPAEQSISMATYFALGMSLAALLAFVYRLRAD